ncbi:hypothetical protein B296_00052089, partial [Ensete ventricosum]
ALALLHPHCTVATVAAPAQATVALASRQPLPLHVGGRPAKGRPAPPPLLAVGLTAGSSPLQAPYNRPNLWALRCKRLCPRAVACGLLPLLASSHPLTGSWPPLLATFTAKMQQECVEQFYTI